MSETFLPPLDEDDSVEEIESWIERTDELLEKYRDRPHLHEVLERAIEQAHDLLERVEEKE